MISHLSIRFSSAKAGVRAIYGVLAVLLTTACGDATAPNPPGPTIQIVPVADSVFEGDTVHLTAQVLDEAGVAAPNAVVIWTVSDATLAELVGDGTFALLHPGTVRITARSGTAIGTYDLGIGRLVVQRVELTPQDITMGRTDRLTITARAVGQGDRPITGRTVTFTADDEQVAVVYGPIPSTSSGLLIAVGSGSTTIRASVDGVTGTAGVGVVDADTTFTLTQYNDSPLPMLVELDSTIVDGEKTFFEIYADSGTLVLSGRLQERYELDVEYSVYRLIGSGDTVERELVLQSRGQHDAGVVTVGANGSLSMLSELIGPHLEHSAMLLSDGYRVHFRIPGENSFLDLTYERLTP